MPKQTGPKTAEGKAKSSRNALKHGLTSTRMFVFENEIEEIWEEMLEHSTARLQPRDECERMIVIDIAHAQWRLRRARTWESGLIDLEMQEQFDEMQAKYSPVDEAIRQSRAFKGLSDNSNALENLKRYETSARRAFKAGLAALEQLRALSGAKPEPEPEPKPRPTPPPHLRAEWDCLHAADPNFDPTRHPYRMSAELRQWWRLPRAA